MWGQRMEGRGRWCTAATIVLAAGGEISQKRTEGEGRPVHRPQITGERVYWFQGQAGLQ